MGDPLFRGSTEGANCVECPFSHDGKSNRPVLSEYPENPAWILLGDIPSFNETRLGRPMCSATGQVVDQILHKIGQKREHLWLGKAVLCQAPQTATPEQKEKAAEACKPRLLKELALFPGKPVLTLGAITARALIPKAILDKIDPPDVPKSRKKSQKEKQKSARKEECKRGQAINRIANRRFKKLIKFRRAQLIREVIRRYGRKPDKAYLTKETERDVKSLWAKAWREAPVEYDQKLKERELNKQNKTQKPRKKKPIKISDIVGTLFDIDVDGSGIRPVIPAIHPASLLRGGGATIGGSHTPDMAFINIIYDAAKVDALAKGKDIRLKINSVFEVIDQEKATRLFLEALQDALDEGSCSIDLETYVDDPDRHHALMAYVAKIRVIGIATKNRSVSVAWDLLPDWIFSYFQLALGKSHTVFHNGLYDRTVLRAYGFILPIVGLDEDAPGFTDTLLAHHASFPGNAHNLQIATSQFFGIKPWKSQYRNQEETLDKLAIYNSLDTACTHALVAPLQIWVKKTQTEVIYERDKKMADIASRMHLRGMKVSREVNSQLVSTFTRLSRDAKRVVDDKANDPKIKQAIKHHLALILSQKKRKDDPIDFEERYNIRLADLKNPDWRWNVNNSKHVAALLQGMGVQLFQTTDSGAISTKKEVLESLVDVGIVRDLLEYRENDKMLDFVWPLFDREINGEIVQYGFADPNDRIHPIWSIHKISGRWAASEPSGISNAPREKPKQYKAGEILPRDSIIIDTLCLSCKEPKYKHKEKDHPFIDGDIIIAQRPTTKRQFIAGKGRKLVGFDFAQVEARVLALLSGDTFMCDVFGRDGDLHTECARVVFPGFDDKSAKERKSIRTVCKTLEYATWYGAADEKVWKGLLKEGYNFKLADVAKSLAILRQKMSGIVQWQRDTIRKASQAPFELRDFVGGRRRVWPMGQVEASEALNSVPQFTAATIMNTGMEKIDQRLIRYKEAFPIAQIHDAAVFECNEDDAHKIKQDVTDCFSQEYENSGKRIKFPVEVEIADEWANV